MADDFDDDGNHSDEEEAPTLAQRQQAMKSRMNLDDLKAVPCHACGKKVFEKEKLQVDGKAFHRLGCFKCAKCKTTLIVGKHASLKGVFYCVPHYTELLKAAGGKIDKVGADLQLDSTAIVKGDREQQATAEAQKFASSSSDRIKEAREAGSKAAADKARLEKEAEKTQATYDMKKQQSVARVASTREQTQTREKEEEAKKKAAEEESKKKAEESKKKAEEESKKKKDDEAKKKADGEAKKKADDEAKKKADESKKTDDAKKKADEEAKKKADEESKKKAGEATKKKAEEEAKKKAEEEAKKKAEEEAKKEAEKAASSQSATPKWQKLTTDEGDIYYYNAATDQSLWEKPADYDGPDEGAASAPAAPATATASAWQKQTTDTGDVYFFNPATGESVWDQPADYQE